MFHSTFKSGSMNGRVALYAMILVTVRGIVGRFVYRQVHIGLYGRELTLADAEQELMTSSEGVNSTFVFHPEILGRLKSFREAAFAEMNSIPRRTWRFCSMGWRGKILVHSIRDMVQKELVVTAKRNNWSGSQTKLGYQLAMQQIERYVVAVSKAARYSTWQYIFSFWHLIHLPFLYLLVLSGIFHVIAVHMY